MKKNKWEQMTQEEQWKYIDLERTKLVDLLSNALDQNENQELGIIMMSLASLAAVVLHTRVQQENWQSAIKQFESDVRRQLVRLSENQDWHRLPCHSESDS